MNKKCVSVFSGGLDSATMLLDSVYQHGAENVWALSFNYGQRHSVELMYAINFCEKLGVKHNVVNLSSINELLAGSALTDDVEVPEGHYEWETMKQTVVPNRNAIMANIAIGACVSVEAEILRLGIHAGDHAVYPDCRPEFVDALEALAHKACEGFIHKDFIVDCPWLHVEKDAIASAYVEAAEKMDLDLTLGDTWSCYKGGEQQCGRCSTCVERIEAIYKAGVQDFDDTVYMDPDYWKEVVGWQE